MLIHTETRLRDFQFWSGGADNANCLSYEQLDELENLLEEIYPDGMTDTQVNDLLWFDEDIVAEWLGFADFEDLRKEGVPWR